jgi:chemotaxis response regulator CheB
MRKTALITDEPVLAEGFRSLLAGSEHVLLEPGSFETANLVNVLERMQPDTVLLNWNKEGGLEALSNFCVALPRLRVVMVARDPSPELAESRHRVGLQTRVRRRRRSDLCRDAQQRPDVVPLTDPFARLFKKTRGAEAKLAYMGHVLTENRNGLVVDVRVTQATGTAERDAAVEMLSGKPASKPATLSKAPPRSAA